MHPRPKRKQRATNRFAEVAKLGELVFHTDDLANLWHITNSNTLYTTIKRYVAQGLLFRIHKGFYSVKPPGAIDPLLLGLKALHRYAYVSTETILALHGVIQQEVPAVTLISDITKRFSVAGNQYYTRALADHFLYNPCGILEQDHGVRKASLERAVADLLYFNRYAHLDAARRIDWKKVRMMQQDIGYPATAAQRRV